MTLTNNDLKNIKILFKTTIDEDETLVRKDDIKHLPTKEEFFNKEDKVIKEIKTAREEMSLLSDTNRKINDCEIRIEKVEKKLGIQPAV